MSAPETAVDLQATPEDEALTCRVCGATGFARCDLAKHAATILGFAAQMTREKRIDAMKRAEETP